MPGAGKGGEPPMQLDRDLIARARDGIGLATDLYRPDGSGTFPLILERTPYDKSAPSRSERTAAVATPRSRAEVAAYFVAHGYAVAFQDCRGRYRSEGRFTKYLSEAEDGFDTLAWFVGQPWCNGRVATMGLSYAAHAQMALGCLDPPGLAAQFIDCGGFSNAYRSGIRHGGAFDLKQATWAWRNALADARDPETRKALATQDIAAWFARLPGHGWRRGQSRSARHRITRITCSSNGRMAALTNSGSSPASMRKAITTATPTRRWCTCPVGMTPTRGRQWKITRASRARGGGRPS
jgi:putative CocE/NonD family hydrolase